MARFRAIGRNGESLRPRRHEADRAIDALCSERNQRRSRSRAAARAEAAADKPRLHANVLDGNTQLPRDGAAQPVHELARLVDRELVARPGAGGVEQFHRVVMLRRRAVAGLDLHGSGGKCRSSITDFRVLVIVIGVLHLLRGRAGRIERRGRDLLVVIDADLEGCLMRSLLAVGDHDGDDLTVVPDLLGFERRRCTARNAAGIGRRLELTFKVLEGEDVEHAGDGPCFVQVERPYAPFGDGARHEGCERQILKRHVGGILRFAGNFKSAIDARAGLADAAVLKRLNGHFRPPSRPRREERA